VKSKNFIDRLAVGALTTRVPLQVDDIEEDSDLEIGDEENMDISENN
jgi:hypothetical protein